MPISKNIAQRNSTWTLKDEAVYRRGERKANRRIKKHGEQLALDVTELLENFAEEVDVNSYGLAQEFIRQFRTIWRRT